MNLESSKIYLNLNPVFPALPKADDKTKVNVRYALIPPFAFVHIYWDSVQSELIYEVEEPSLNDAEREIFSKIEIISFN